MTKASTKVKPKSKKIGRPVTIAAEHFVGLKLPTALLEAIDAWATDHKASRSETIRRLCEAGLKTGDRGRR
jgi:hypothetical protein